MAGKQRDGLYPIPATLNRAPAGSSDWLRSFKSEPHPRTLLGPDSHTSERLERAFAERRKQWAADTARIVGAVGAGSAGAA